MQTQFTVQTQKRNQMIDITHQVRGAAMQSGIREGICVVYIPHTTAGITINENADPDVVRDMLYELDKVVPHEDGYHHFEGNSAAHIKATMTGFSQTVLIHDGELVLGRWQGIYFCEYDGPRTRTVIVKTMEEK